MAFGQQGHDGKADRLGLAQDHRSDVIEQAIEQREQLIRGRCGHQRGRILGHARSLDGRTVVRLAGSQAKPVYATCQVLPIDRRPGATRVVNRIHVRGKTFAS